MWIQIKQGNRFETINTDKISKICIIELSIFVNYYHKEFSKFSFCNKSEAEAWYKGFQIAIQGQDFVSNEDDYIKPLLSSKNEAMHRYLLYNETLNNLI